VSGGVISHDRVCRVAFTAVTKDNILQFAHNQQVSQQSTKNFWKATWKNSVAMNPNKETIDQNKHKVSHRILPPCRAPSSGLHLFSGLLLAL